MLILNEQNYQYLLLGSLFFGCGGGLDYKAHKKIFDNIFKYKSSLIIKDISEFKNEDWLASVYGVGDPSKVKVNFRSLILKALKTYEEKTKIKIKGIIPGEIGAEGLAFQAASYLNLPVVDSDLVGGRAAPEIQMDCFSVFNVPLTPLLGYAVNDKALFLLGKFSAKEIENLLRDFFAKNKGVGILIGYPIQKIKFEKICIKNTLSYAIEVGKILYKKDLKSLVKFVKPFKVIEEQVKNIYLKSEDGFYQGFIYLKNHKIFVKNENIYIERGNKRIFTAPDLIVIVNENLFPIHNTEVKNYLNKKVFILLIKARGYWKLRKAKNLWKVI